MSIVGVFSNVARRAVSPAIMAGASYAVLKSLSAFKSPDARPDSSRNMAPLYATHKPTTPMQKLTIALGSALMGLGDPTDGSHIAALGDATANGHFDKIKAQMIQDPVGRRILKERPEVSFTPEEWKDLKNMPEGSFGHTYYEQMTKNGISWTTRPPVKFIDNEEEAYIMLRYRQCHDFYHTLLDMDISVVEELAIKVFEWRQTGLPVGLIASVVGPLRLPQAERARFFKYYLPWALQCGSVAKPIISIYWEEIMSRPVDEVRKEMGIWLLPERNSVTHAENSTAIL